MIPLGILVCPELEELVIEHDEEFDLGVIEWAAAARAVRGAELKVVRIVSWYGDDMKAQLDASELKNHVSRVDWGLKDSWWVDSYFSWSDADSQSSHHCSGPY